MTTPRQESVKWAKDLLAASNFLVLDLETTDKNPLVAEPVQISLIKSDGKTLMNMLVKPKGEINAEAIAIHGITLEKIGEGAPDFEDVYPMLKSLMDGQTIVVYNVGFDRAVLQETCKRLGLEEINTDDSKWQCAMLQYAQFAGDWNPLRRAYRWQKLSDACSFFKIEIKDAHDAAADTRMTLAMVKAMAAYQSELDKAFDEPAETTTADSPLGEIEDAAFDEAMESAIITTMIQTPPIDPNRDPAFMGRYFFPRKLNKIGVTRYEGADDQMVAETLEHLFFAIDLLQQGHLEMPSDKRQRYSFRTDRGLSPHNSARVVAFTDVRIPMFEGGDVQFGINMCNEWTTAAEIMRQAAAAIGDIEKYAQPSQEQHEAEKRQQMTQERPPTNGGQSSQQNQPARSTIQIGEHVCYLYESIGRYPNDILLSDLPNGARVAVAINQIERGVFTATKGVHQGTRSKIYDLSMPLPNPALKFIQKERLFEDSEKKFVNNPTVREPLEALGMSVGDLITGRGFLVAVISQSKGGERYLWPVGVEFTPDVVGDIEF